jgi:hypothetical protein
MGERASQRAYQRARPCEFACAPWQPRDTAVTRRSRGSSAPVTSMSWPQRTIDLRRRYASIGSAHAARASNPSLANRGTQSRVTVRRRISP